MSSPSNTSVQGPESPQWPASRVQEEEPHNLAASFLGATQTSLGATPRTGTSVTGAGILLPKAVVDLVLLQV